MRPQMGVRCGAFELLEPIGAGGMGEVFLARHGQGQRAAVKLLTQSRALDARYRATFRREVYALAQLDHPGIARIYDFGFVDEGAADGSVAPGTPWFAMEYVEGVTARQAARRWGWAELRGFTVALLDALAHAHARQVLHRDLKPSNVLVCPAQAASIALVDFGIAEMYRVERDREAAKAARSTYGTPRYMPPEQILGETRQGPWTDLYAAGCLIWGLVCGQTAHQGESSEALLQAHLDGTIVKFRPAMAVPAGLEGWLKRLLARRPSARFGRAADARRELLALDAARVVMPGWVARSAESESAEAPTLVDPTEVVGEDGATELLDMANELRPGMMRGLEGSSGRARQVASLVPVTWRGRREGGASRPVGMNLFGLRKLPFINRDAERDALWEALRKTVNTNQAQAVMVRGAAGCGKSRLVDWFAERVHETGAATPIRVTHSRPGTPADGLASALVRWFQCAGLAWTEALERLNEEFGALGMDRDARLADAAGLLDLAGSVERGDGLLGFGFGSALEFNQTLVRIFEALASRRAVVLWLDDVVRSAATLSFVRHVFASRGQISAPMLVVMTSREDEMSAADEVLSWCSDHLEVAPLGAAHQVELIRRMLPFDDVVVDRLVERTEGHPLFAVQIVRDWVDRGLVEQRGDRVVFVAEDDGLPADLHRLWQRRLEQLLRRREGFDEAGRVSLELAATLGKAVDPREWRAACDGAGVEASQELVGRMAEAGLAVPDVSGWSFVHGLLAESLRRLAGEAGRLDAHHQRCARVLAELYDDGNERALERCAEHWVKARRPRRAYGPLRQAAAAATSRGDYERALVYIERQREVLAAAGIDREGWLWADNDVQRSSALLSHGRIDEGRQIVERIYRWAGARRGRRALKVKAEALASFASLENMKGDYRRALELIEPAEQLARELDDALLLAGCLRFRGFFLWQLNRYPEARRVFSAARGLYESLRREVSALRCDSMTAWCYFEEGDSARVREIARRLLRDAREHSSRGIEASGHNLLGELARLEGDWVEAFERYDEAAIRWRHTGSRAAVIALLNMLLAAVGARQWEIVDHQGEVLWKELAANGFEARRPQISLSRALAALERGDEVGWREHFEALEEGLGRYDYRNQDLPWLAQRGVEVARERGEWEKARRLLGLEVRLWDELGQAEKAAAAREALRS